MNFDLRPAEARDVPDLARLQVVGSEGVIDAIYDGLIPGLSVAEMIERRFFFLDSTKSYHNCWVAEAEGNVLGDLHAHSFDAMNDDPSDPIVPEDRYAVGEPFESSRSRGGRDLSHQYPGRLPAVSGTRHRFGLA